MQRRTAIKLLGSLGAAGLAQQAAGQSQTFEPLGRVEIPESAETVVAEDGQTAYVATQDGFTVVDLTDPASPAVIAEITGVLADRETGPLANIQDVKVDGDRLLIAGPANPQRDEQLQGIAVYDVSTPSDPQRVLFHETDYPIHNGVLDDGVAYLTGTTRTGGGDIHIVDVSDDEAAPLASVQGPALSDSWEDVTLGFLGTPHDVWVNNETLYVPRWDAGTWLIDVGDPATPELLGHIEGLSVEEYTAERTRSETRTQFIEPPGNHHYVQSSPDGSLLAIGVEAWNTNANDDTGGPGGITLWDVSSPADPTKLSTITPPDAYLTTRDGYWTTSHNFDIRGDRLYTSWYQGGVKLYDISDPANPEQLAWWRNPDQAAFWSAASASEEFFVGGLVSGYPQLETTGSGLYTFPNRPGEQPNPPSLTETPTPVPTDTPTPSSTPSPTPTPVPETATPTEQTNVTTTQTPGFTTIGGLAAGGILGYRLLAEADSSEEDSE